MPSQNCLCRVVALLCVELAVLISFPQRVASAAEPVLKSGLDIDGFDRTVKPNQDFYEFVNGNWNKQNPIPPEYTRWGAFSQLRDENLVSLRTILDDLTKEKGPLTGNRQKLRDFYLTAMDEASRNKLGVAPLADDFAKIAKLGTTDELLSLVGEFHASGISSMFSFGVGQDAKISTQHVAHFWQGGTGLPEKEYYLSKGEDSQKIRDEYRQHVERMFVLLEDAPDAAKTAADVVLKIETQLAEAMRAPVQLRDREANYNKKTLKELADLTPNLKWDVYWRATGAKAHEKELADVVIGQPEFLDRVNELAKSVAMDDWKSYLRWHLIHATASQLSEPFEKESFHFYGEILHGAKEQQPRWKRAVNAIDGDLGEALGQIFVEKHFPPEAKQRMDALVKNVLASFRERIETREWMGSETKQQATAKLATVMTKIGYPDKWKDYSKLEIRPDSYAANNRRANRFHFQFDLDKLGKPVDRTEWGMTPPTVNAYYNSSKNEIVFPAGILRPPFFNAEADDAVNYGGIGAVIGHEITHGFDDQGSRSDAQGNLRNWWTTEDRTNFTAKTDILVKQFEACKAVDGQPVNGKLTLGENIADLGGVIISYSAYQKSLGGKTPAVLDGFSGSQRFFLGYAQVWRGATRDAEARVRLRTDPHSPMTFRVFVPLSNVPKFYEAFDIKPGDGMYRAPAERLEIW